MLFDDVLPRFPTLKVPSAVLACPRLPDRPSPLLLGIGFLQEFIKRTGDFAVMIGLSLHGKPVLGVVHAPALQTPKTYYAVADQGAFVLTGGEDQCGDGGLAGSERMR